jgi:hypothetical protein
MTHLVQFSENENTDVARAYVKVGIDLSKIQSNKDLQAIVAALRPGALFEPWVGIGWIIVRYPTRELANARALDAECAAYCGLAEIEESYAYQEQERKQVEDTSRVY